MNAERLGSTWAGRDFPVLLAAARMLEQGEKAHDRYLMRDTGFDMQTVVLALTALNGTYLEANVTQGLRGVATGITERGRRVTGLWPARDGMDGLADLLRDAESTTNDPEERSALRRAAGALYGIGRDVGTDVAAAWVRAQAGI